MPSDKDEDDEGALFSEDDLEWEEEDAAVGFEGFGFGTGIVTSGGRGEGDGTAGGGRGAHGEGVEGHETPLEVRVGEEEGSDGDGSEGADEPEGEEVTKKRKRRTWDASVREAARETHKAHVLLLSARALSLERCVRTDELIRSRVLSLVPPSKLNAWGSASTATGDVTKSQSTMAKKKKRKDNVMQNSKGETFSGVIDEVMRYLRSLFHVVSGFGAGNDFESAGGRARADAAPLLGGVNADAPHGKDEGMELDEALCAQLNKVIDGTPDGTRRCSVEALAAVACVMFRILGFEARLVCALNPLGFKPGCLDDDHHLDDIHIHWRSHLAGSGSASGRRRRAGPSRGDKEPPRKGFLRGEDVAREEPSPGADATSSEGKRGGMRGDTEGEEVGENRKKGDVEFDVQLAVALAATAVQADRRRSGSSSKGKQRELTTEVTRGQRKLDTSLPVTHWLEIYRSASMSSDAVASGASTSNAGGGGGGRWIPVDVYRTLIDCASAMEAAAIKGRPLTYCVAVDNGALTDVTRRYTARISQSISRRACDKWWRATVSLLRGGKAVAANDGGSDAIINIAGIEEAEERAMQEEKELEEIAKGERLPSNQAEYKKHPMYALERWLTKYQIIHPRKPILGYIAGQPVFPRSNVHDLHTADRWLREGRQVLDDEMDKPMKRIDSREQQRLERERKKRAREEHEADGFIEDAAKPSACLYGVWQTKAYTPPKAENGKVPRNARGHVDVWSPEFVPNGATHLKLPYISGIAKRLGIDYAAAMVGFEMKTGRPVPKFDGIVVCSEFVDLLKDAYEQEAARREEEAVRRATQEAMSRWRSLLRIIWRRHTLELENAADSVIRGSGNGGGDAGNACPEKLMCSPRDVDERDVKRGALASADELPVSDNADPDGGRADDIFREHLF